MSPALSVIVATHERRDLVRRCIEALSRQSQDFGDFEVIVADDGSRDDTADVLSELRTPFALRVLQLERRGQAAAQNAAIEKAGGTVCLFLDDDVIAEPQLVEEHLAAHREADRLIGVGRLIQVPPRSRDWYAREFASSWNDHYERLGESEIDWTACFGANFSVARAALADLGGFATDLPVGEDMELAFRLQQAGYQPRYLPTARAEHDDQKPRGKLLEDSRRQGAGQVELSERFPDMRPKLLGWFTATSRREVALRRLLIALRIPPGLLAPLGRLLPGPGRREIWFHLVSRFAFWRAVRMQVSRKRWRQLTAGVPILMYHAFSAGEEGDRYVVSRRAFGRQLRLLRLLGYRGIRFDEVVEALRESRLPPPRAVAITIDDGYLDNLEIAQPLLDRYGFPATIFLVSGGIGGVNDWTADGALAQRPLLDHAQIEQLREAGIRLGAHTRHHPRLPELTKAEIAEEVRGSRADLEALLGVPVEYFAYPYGLFDERAVETVRDGDFRGACTVKPRLASLDEDPVLIPRIEVRSSDSLLRFALNLWLGIA